MHTCAELFTASLDEKNLRYTVGTDRDGDTIVDFPYDGKIAKCFFSGDNGEYFSLYLVYERIPEEKLADLIFMCN